MIAFTEFHEDPVNCHTLRVHAVVLIALMVATVRAAAVAAV